MRDVVVFAYNTGRAVWIANVGKKDITKYLASNMPPGLHSFQVADVGFDAVLPDARVGVRDVVLVRANEHYNLLYWPLDPKDKMNDEEIFGDDDDGDGDGDGDVGGDN